MNEADQQQLTDYWDRETRYVNEKIYDVFKLAQDHAYELGLKRGLARPESITEKMLRKKDEEISQLKSAISWALGEGDSDFGDNKPEGAGAFWWRKELKQRAESV